MGSYAHGCSCMQESFFFLFGKACKKAFTKVKTCRIDVWWEALIQVKPHVCALIVVEKLATKLGNTRSKINEHHKRKAKNLCGSPVTAMGYINRRRIKRYFHNVKRRRNTRVSSAHSPSKKNMNTILLLYTMHPKRRNPEVFSLYKTISHAISTRKATQDAKFASTLNCSKNDFPFQNNC